MFVPNIIISIIFVIFYFLLLLSLLLLLLILIKLINQSVICGTNNLCTTDYSRLKLVWSNIHQKPEYPAKNDLPQGRCKSQAIK